VTCERGAKDIETQVIRIPEIRLQWSSWYTWAQLLVDGRKRAGVHIPNKKSGVYEARLRGQEARLTIGETRNLRYRIRQGLVKGKAPHSSGGDIRRYEDTTQVEVRWAETARHRAAEEELHRQHVVRAGRLPTYTDH